MANLQTKRFEIDSALELVADHWTAETADTSRYLSASLADRVTLSPALITPTGTQAVNPIVGGVIDEYELILDAKGVVTTQLRGRDQAAFVLDTFIQKRYALTPFPQVLQSTFDYVTQPPTVVGFWMASQIVNDILQTNQTGLTLSWEVRDYQIRETFNASGRVIDVIRQLVEPWLQVEPFRADIFVQGSVLIVRYRSIPLTLPVLPTQVPLILPLRIDQLPKAAQPPQTPDLVIDMTSLRRARLVVRKRHLRKLYRIILRGQLIPMAITGGNFKGNNLTTFITSQTFDANGNVIAETDERLTYLLPDGLLQTDVKTTYTAFPGTSNLQLSGRESVLYTYDLSPTYNGTSATRPAKIQATQTVHEGFRSDNQRFDIIEIDELSYTYDVLGFLTQTSNLVLKLDTSSGQLRQSALKVETHRDLGALIVEKTVESFVFNPTGGPTLLNREQQISGGYRAGGPGASRQGTMPTTGATQPLFVFATLNNDPTLQTVTYDNRNLNQDDLNFLASLFAAADGVLEFEVELAGPAVPWVTRSMRLQINNAVDNNGTPIPLPLLTVTEVRTTYTEEGTPGYLMPTVRAFGWSTS